MADQTLNSICKTGAFPNAFIYHICGMPWASTNDVAFSKWIAESGTDQTALRTKLFGDDSLNVQVLANLGNAEGNQLGSQSITYAEDKGLSVGGWSVSISGDNVGFVWKNGTTMEQWGIIGLGWQPVESTDNAGHTMLVDDIIPDLDNDNQCVVRWDQSKDVGMYDWIIDKWNGTSYDEDLYIYVGSSCLRPIQIPVTGTNDYYVTCQSGKLNAPNEEILALSNGQNIFVSNYPQGIEGLTANLYSVLFEDDELLSGTTPFFMRTGKVKNNATEDSSGNWKLSMGGFTEQLKFKNTIGSYSGFLSGFHFNKNDLVTVSTKKEYHMPILTVTEIVSLISSGAVYPSNETIEIDSDYVDFDNVGEILDFLVDEMNSNTSLRLQYINTGDDIVYDPDSIDSLLEVDYVAVRGLAPMVAGIGYTVQTSGFKNYLESITDPINHNFCDTPSDTYPVQYGDIFLRSNDAEYYDVFEGVGIGISVPVKTKACDYFYMYDLAQGKRGKTNYEHYKEHYGTHIPENSDGTRSITITDSSVSNIEKQIGMSLQFGHDSEEGLSMTGVISTVTGDEVTFVSNYIVGAPTGFYSNSKVLEAIYDDPNYLKQVAMFASLSDITVDDVIAKFTGDYFAVKDMENIVLNSGTDIFKGILGDPDTDVGFNIGAIKTDIKNLFNRGESNFVEMINWTKFEELIEANEIAGVTFKYTPESNGVDVLALLSGVCLTYNIQMIWEYNADNRAWWLTFDNFGAGNGTTAVLNGRSITAQDIAVNNLTAIVGGGWYYNKLAGQYQSKDGSNIMLNYQLTDGRVGHSLHDKVLTINDKVTQLPVDSVEAQDTIIKHFTAMTRLFSQIVYKQKLTLNMRKTALVGVGRWSSVAWAPIQNRQTGRRNDGSLVGQMQSMTIDLSSCTISTDILSYPNTKKGIAPSFYTATMYRIPDSQTFRVSGLNTDPALNDFADRDGLLADFQYFGCMGVESGKVIDRDCGCGYFAITVFERNPTDGKLYFDPDYTYTSQNVFRGNMTSPTTTNGNTIYFTVEGNADQLDVNKDWVITFADRANTNLQPCQTELYGWLANNKNKVTLSDSTTKNGIKVGN